MPDGRELSRAALLWGDWSPEDLWMRSMQVRGGACARHALVRQQLSWKAPQWRGWMAGTEICTARAL